MSSTGSVNLVIEKFSQLTSCKWIAFNANSFHTNCHFGIHPKTVVHSYCGENVSIYLLSLGSTFKYKANVSILNPQNDKLFTKEYFGDFKDIGNKYDENYFRLMPRSELLSHENSYLYNGTLTLLCELEVLENRMTESISKDLNNLSENFQSLLTDGKLTDAALFVGKDAKEFRVHKAILSARSSVFAAMFEHDCEEKRQNKVNITDMDDVVCAEMMSYIYSGKVKDLEKYAMELLVAADKYQLDSLKTFCEQYLLSANLEIETVSNVLILADLHQVTALKSKCIEFICANADQVQSTDGWKVLDTNVKLVKELFLYSTKKK